MATWFPLMGWDIDGSYGNCGKFVRSFMEGSRRHEPNDSCEKARPATDATKPPQGVML
jgi:hypothetical protein